MQHLYYSNNKKNFSALVKKIDKNTSYNYNHNSSIIPPLHEVINYYQDKIKIFHHWIYKSNDINSITYKYFCKKAELTIEKVLDTFFNKKEYWRDEDRSLHLYILVSLNNLARQIKEEAFSEISTKTKVLNCPACKTFIKIIAKTAYCPKCQNDLSNLQSLLFNQNQFLSSKIKFYQAFAQHSIKGKECPDCHRFLPLSLGLDLIQCPFLDCCFSGKLTDLKSLTHPGVAVNRKFVELNSVTQKSDNDAKFSNNKISLQNKIRLQQASADFKIEIINQFDDEVKLIEEAIAKLNKLKYNGHSFTLLQKQYMYQAYLEVLKLFPEEMVRYLVHLDSFAADFGLQSYIFQHYATIIENLLPLIITKSKQEILITDLTDLNLNLFLGQSQFLAKIDSKCSITNLTSEQYIGTRKFNNQGKCFIGFLIDLININSGKSILSTVKNYDFNNIQLQNDNNVIGQEILVKHFRIAPHYQLGPMIILQKVRNELVDHIYYKIHGKKRI